jgi:hypothetical protein
MQKIKRRVLASVILAVVALGPSAMGADRERGPREPGRSVIKRLLVAVLDYVEGQISIPPGK